MRRKTTEEFIKSYTDKFPQSSLQIIGKYVNARTKIKYRCKECNRTFEALPSNLMNGQKCPKCGKKEWGEKRRTQAEEFKEKLYKLNQNIQLLDEYKTSREKVTCYCKICKKTWKRTAALLLLNPKCPICNYKKGRTTRKSHNAFVAELKEINPDIEVLGKYKTRNKKIKVKCKKCSHKWKASPGNLLMGTGCPICNISKGENKIKKFLCENNIKFIQQYRMDKCRDKYPLPFDFYLPEYNMCIEYDGQQHFMPLGYNGGNEKMIYTQNHDQIKNNFCKDNNINLLRIKYTEYDNVENILKKELNILGGDA